MLHILVINKHIAGRSEGQLASHCRGRGTLRNPGVHEGREGLRVRARVRPRVRLGLGLRTRIGQL